MGIPIKATNISTLPKLERCSITDNATLIYTHELGDKVYMFRANDYGSKRQAFGFVVMSADGSTSRTTYVKRHELKTSKTPLDFMYNYLTDFTHDDIAKMKNRVHENIDTACSMDFSESVSPEELYLSICEYCEFPCENDNDYIDIVDGYCNIITSKFDSIIKNLECGYKKLETLRELKLMGLLRTNGGRAYDHMMTDKNKNSYRVYSIKYLDEQAREAYRAAYLDKSRGF